MKDLEEKYGFAAQLAALTNEQLVGRFNQEVGCQGWGNARSYFLTCLKLEFEKRQIDLSTISTADGYRLARRIELRTAPLRVVPTGFRELTDAERDKLNWEVNNLIGEWLGNDISRQGEEDYERLTEMYELAASCRELRDYVEFFSLYSSILNQLEVLDVDRFLDEDLIERWQEGDGEVEDELLRKFSDYYDIAT